MASATHGWVYRPLRLRALLALLFAGAALGWHEITLGQFVLLFGAYLFLDGIAAILCGAASSHPGVRWAFFTEGAACCAVGVVAFVHPFISTAVLFLIASWGIMTGVLELIAATWQQGSMTSQWLQGLAGLSSIFLGMLLMAVPGAGSIAVVRVIGFYALAFSVLLFLASLVITDGVPASPRRIVAS